MAQGGTTTGETQHWRRARSRSRRGTRVRSRRSRARSPPARRPRLSRLPGLESVEPARRPAARGQRLRGDRCRRRCRRAGSRRLRLRALAGQPDGHPDHGRSGLTGEDPGVVRLRRRERSRPVPDPRERSPRGRRRPARADRRPRSLPPVRAVRARTPRWALACRVGRDLEPPLERPATGRLDVGGRRRATHPAELARYDQVARGRIDHALVHRRAHATRVRISGAALRERRDPDPTLPPMGLRFRLKASYPIAGFPRQARIVLTALKRYGMIVADNGSSWYVTGRPTRVGRTTTCTRCVACPGSAFEVVDTRSLRP